MCTEHTSHWSCPWPLFQKWTVSFSPAVYFQASLKLDSLRSQPVLLLEVGGQEVLGLLPPFFLSFFIKYIYIYQFFLFRGMTHCLLDVRGYFRTFCGEIRRCDNIAIDCSVSLLPVQLMILCDGSFHHAFCFGKISSEVPYYTGTHETDLTWKEKNSLKWKKAEEYLYIRKWSFFINQREMYM